MPPEPCSSTTAGTDRGACGPGGRYSRPSAVVNGAAPISSGANGLLLGQLTAMPGMSASEAGSGHGSPSRDQLTVAAIAHSTEASRRIVDNPLDNRAPSLSTYRVFLK